MEKENYSFEENISQDAKRYLENVRDGCILLSSDALEDPNFKTTIVLMCVYNKEGAFGLIVNRPSYMPIGEVFDIAEEYRNEKRCFYIGGPVQQESLHVIQLKQEGAKNAHQVAPLVFLGGEWNFIEEILQEYPATTRLFLGYSGWGPGQLETEIAEGAWEVYTVDTFDFLTKWEKPLYHDLYSIREHLQKLEETKK